MVCSACRVRPIAPNRRRYCTLCGRRASALWKRRQRCAWKESGQKYWLDNWKHKTPEERKAYYRAYMRAYRRRLRRSLILLDRRRSPVHRSNRRGRRR